jgi:hypothetical protein
MDLALLVYGISLLGKIEGFIIFIIMASFIVLFISGLATSSWKFSGYEYSWNLNGDGTVKDSILAGRRFGEKSFKYSAIILVLASFTMIFIPNEKTAYTMVGAYAAQKVVENDKVQDMSGKVLTIINQKLDTYIEEGVHEVENKVKGEKK